MSSLVKLPTIKKLLQQTQNPIPPPPADSNTQCSNKCILCRYQTPYILYRKPTWENKLYISFICINYLNGRPSNQYVNLKRELYPFIEQHRHLLNFKSLDINYRKKLQDILNHKKSIFKSGFKKLKQTGYWKIKVSIHPWYLKTTIKKTLKLNSEMLKLSKKVNENTCNCNCNTN